MSYKTIVRALNGKPVIYVRHAPADHLYGLDCVIVRMRGNEFSIRTSQWDRLPVWRGPYAVIEAIEPRLAATPMQRQRRWHVINWSALNKA